MPASGAIDIRQDDFRLEDHSIVIRTHFSTLKLLRKVSHVVTQSEEVLLLGVGDPVEKDNPSHDLELFGSL